MKEDLLPLMLMVIVCLISGIGVGYSIAITKLNKECIERGIAKYEVDNSGNVKFVWLVEKKEPKP